jgi:hypothetical protein
VWSAYRSIHPLPSRPPPHCHGAATAPDHGTATAVDHGTATAPDHGTATAPDHGTATALDHGTATALDHVHPVISPADTKAPMRRHAPTGLLKMVQAPIP